MAREHGWIRLLDGQCRHGPSRMGAFPVCGVHWQRQAKANGLLILPRWDAVVHWNPPAAPVQLISAAIEEGRAWKRLGVRYSTGSMVADIRRGRGPEGSDAEAAPTPPELITRGHRIHGLLRPFFLWTGNHLF